MKKDFKRSVLAQKSGSKKHDISNLLLALAGDVTDESQSQKMNILKSELSQHRDDYIFIISPQKVLTIYNIYTAREHPLKHVMLEVQDAVFFIGGLQESLTNERRQVKIELKVNYIHDPKDKEERPHKFTLKSIGSKNEARFLDDIEYLSITDDMIRIGDQSDSLLTSEKDGKIASPSEVLIWSEKQNRVGMILRTISHEGKPMQDLQQVFDIESKDHKIYFRGLDTKQPLKLNLQYSPSINALQSTFTLDHIHHDVSRVLKSLIFLQSLSNAAILRCFDLTNNRVFDLQSPDSLIVNHQLVTLYNVLNRLERQTGYKMKISETDAQDNLSSKLSEALDLLSIVEFKYVGSTNLKFRIKLPSKLARKLFEDFDSGVIRGDAYRKLEWLSYYFLGNQIRVKNVIMNFAKLEPKNAQEVLRNMTSNTGTEQTEIELKGIV